MLCKHKVHFYLLFTTIFHHKTILIIAKLLTMYLKLIKQLYRNQYTVLKRFKHKWIRPEGYDTNIKVYNCITKEKVPLIVQNKDRVSWYTCGPTVYDSAHIGHASCYVKLDIIQRILKEYFKLNLTTVMNVTDIDDKIINRSLSLKVSPTELARKFENEFWNDAQNLNIAKPDVIVRVTDNIPIISEFIYKILKENKAYIASDSSVYFDLSQCKDNYGKLVPVVNEESKESAIKKSVGDFAVWKNSKPGEPSWETSLGPGRPGWHSECSALASAIFGNSVDIHAGGIDLRFPHHENEEAISCAHHNKNQWVNYWLHTGQLNLVGDESKMSKSLGNCVFIKDMLNEKKSGDIFRMACAMSHYRANMEYCNELMNTAESQLNKFITFLSDCNDYITRILPPGNVNVNELITTITETNNEIDNALKDDFNTAKTIKAVSKLINVTNKMIHSKSLNSSADLSDCAVISLVGNLVRDQFKILGFTANITEKGRNTANKDHTASILDVLIAFRQNVRSIGLQTKDQELLKHCDSLRDELKMYGIEIKDRGKLSSWNKL